MTVAKKKTKTSTTAIPTIPPNTARSAEAPESGVQKLAERSTDQRRIEELEEQVAKFKGHRDALIRRAALKRRDWTLETYRENAIGAVADYCGKLSETGRGRAEWQAVFDMLLAAVGAAPSQVAS